MLIIVCVVLMVYTDGFIRVACPFVIPKVALCAGITCLRTSMNARKRKRTCKRRTWLLREEVDQASMFEEIVGTSPALRTVLSRISRVAPSDSTVLITGETGVGKELIARCIHRRSNRASRAFISVNCAAIPRDLVLSELFGHEERAFTGGHAKTYWSF